MLEALDLAAQARDGDDVPVGAVVVDASGAVIGRGLNLREASGDPTAHAEVVALREAAATRGQWRLDDCTLVVTLEPCLMCAGAVLAARVPRIVIGAWDAKAGATGSQWDVVRDARIGSKVEVISGVLEHECGSILTEFFAARRQAPQ
ncbi:tRNA adenosine(34) deaminase TadA [Demequina sediminicola]|uniref:tRNA adenosine(34) deaminase TadA n=1 Tax=Demequina sediminicola TaxID=1095026 RepID=UPI0007831883|nr:tRNA adenosine(34) deaminase TadA [Demequina sediminicola]